MVLAPHTFADKMITSAAHRHELCSLSWQHSVKNIVLLSGVQLLKKALTPEKQGQNTAVLRPQLQATSTQPRHLCTYPYPCCQQSTHQVLP
jgi:hypothetical protein